MKKGFISNKSVEYWQGVDFGDFENQPTSQ